MQAPLDPTILINLLLTVFLLAIFMWLFIYLTRGGEIRSGGISNAFINDDEGHQNAFMADIQATEIHTAFNNKKKGHQFFPRLRVTSGGSSQAPNLEENHLLNFLEFIAKLFGRGKYPANSKGKQI